MKDFTMQDLYKVLCPDKPDTWTVSLQMCWPNTRINYPILNFEGYTSSDNAIVAADLFSSLGEDIVSVFRDRETVVEYNGQRVEICIQRVPGVANGGVRY